MNVKTYINFCLLISLCITVFSCSKRHNKETEFAKVIAHYSEEPGDSLKLKAAKFLISNLDSLNTLDTTTVAQNDIYFSLLDENYKKQGKDTALSFEVQSRVIDSLNKAREIYPANPDAKYLNEAEVVTADFLIDNIDDAFYAWQKMPWSKSVSFNDFCEYILPYRNSDTYSLGARKYFLSRYKNELLALKPTADNFEASNVIVKDINNWFSENINLVARYPYLRPFKFSSLLSGRFGDCADANNLRVTALRSLGIPAVRNEIPAWGNSNATHYDFKIIDPLNDTVKSLITNRNISKKTQHIFSASSFDEAKYSDVPKYAQVVYIRSVPKIYRRAVSKQKNSLGMIKSTSDQIPEYFRDPRLKDVTSDYVVTGDIKISIKHTNEKYVYLCVFDNQNWVPVGWAKNDRGFASFARVGKNIIYLPQYYGPNGYEPAGLPFLLDDSGSVKYITAEKNKEKITLYAKFPCRTYVLRWMSYMIGGRFQAANKADLSDTVTLYNISKLPYYQSEIKLKSSAKKFRYLIYQFKGLPKTYVSEIAFYGRTKAGKEVKLSGKIIGNPGIYPYTADKLWDGKRTNLFKANNNANDVTYVGIDLGSHATAVNKIEFMPYTDDNSIVKGDTYELYCWNNTWEYIGTQTASGNSVKFKNVPKNALLLVKNFDGGLQERIFTYNNGRQNFW